METPRYIFPAGRYYFKNREFFKNKKAVRVHIKDEIQQPWILYVWHEYAGRFGIYDETDGRNLGVCIPILPDQPVEQILSPTIQA